MVLSASRKYCGLDLSRHPVYFCTISRTMIAEVTVEKRYQSLTFLILPMSFHVAGIIGPSKNALLGTPRCVALKWY